MRSGMGNLLETDSDVASVSDGEKERTEGDGMESDSLLVNNKNGTSSIQHETGLCNSGLSDPTLSKSGSFPSSGRRDAVDCVLVPPVASASKRVSEGSTKDLCSHKVVNSPRELPPRSQLIQLKPTFSKSKDVSRQPTLSVAPVPDGVNKQKNPRFVPYEPYRGAVRPMVAQDESSASRRHSRSTSDASSTCLQTAISSITLNDCSQENANAQSITKDNAHDQSVSDDKFLKNHTSRNVDIASQVRKQEQVIEKQTHAISLLKERLKIAEKDNNDLHRENVRLKKLLVDSLSGDILQGRMDLLTHDAAKAHSASESVDTLSNEIEVWRSKFLSSCVLVEQLTRENGALNDAVGTAANILKDIKLTCSLSPEAFDEVNTWLRANRGTVASQNNNFSDVDS